MWALRYPDSRALHIARRVLQPATGAPYLGSSLTAHHECTAADDPVPVVIVASERIADSPDWRMLAPGELIEVACDLSSTSRIVLHGPPANYMAPAERDPNTDTFTGPWGSGAPLTSADHVWAPAGTATHAPQPGVAGRQFAAVVAAGQLFDSWGIGIPAGAGRADPRPAL